MMMLTTRRRTAIATPYYGDDSASAEFRGSNSSSNRGIDGGDGKRLVRRRRAALFGRRWRSLKVPRQHRSLSALAVVCLVVLVVTTLLLNHGSSRDAGTTRRRNFQQLYQPSKTSNEAADMTSDTTATEEEGQNEEEEEEYSQDEEEDEEEEGEDFSEAESSSRRFADHEAFPTQYADRHIRRFMAIAEDLDCANPVVDAADADFRADHAADVFAKCRLLVVRNAFDLAFLENYRANYTQFMDGLQTGRISTTGTTTTGDSLFFATRERSRWEIILPERLAHPRLVANAKLLDILRHDQILSQDSGMRSLQCIVSEGKASSSHRGAPGQEWHYDQGFLFGYDSGLQNFGIAGHDLPPTAVTVGVPMLDLERSLGPTEFCMGSSALAGLPDDPIVQDPSLIAEGSLWHEYSQHGDNSCPPSLWRSPLLEFGDVVLFDYGIRHRGGWNESPHLRSILLLIYSRRWFDDINFGDTIRHVHSPEEDSVPDAGWILSRTRLAIPDKDEPRLRGEGRKEKERKLEDMHDFHSVDSEYLMDFETHHDNVEFVVSNVDLDDHPSLYKNDKLVGELPVGTSQVVEGAFGDELTLKSAQSGSMLGHWKLQYHGQVVFTKDQAMGTINNNLHKHS